MQKSPVLVVALALSLGVFACGGDGGSSGGGDAGMDSGADSGNDGGGDAGVDAPVANPDNPNNDTLDTDCDGLTDEEEFANIYPGGLKTDPNNPDTDGDGIPDGVEVGRTTSVDEDCGSFAGDADPATTTIPTQADSDADNVPDGVEDSNQDGEVDNGETDPLSPDTDGDGLDDGVEDADQDGIVDPGETNPRNGDTDDDTIGDGTEVNVTATDPTDDDSDDDTCFDGEEDTNQNGVVDIGETDPNTPDCGAAAGPDTDGDGILDAVEDPNSNGYEPGVETDLNNPDTDGDGLSDGLEDFNANGQQDVGETDPRLPDTDCDGLIDGPDNAGILGEDLNGDGAIDPGETNPLQFDSDGDGIRDGVERGVTINPDATNCTNFLPDADDDNNTDPTDPDTDGDGIVDGAEDTNQNGAVDGGELDPDNPADGTGPAGQVCTLAQLRPVVLTAENEPDIRLAIPVTFTELAPMTVAGEVSGIIGYDDTVGAEVAFFAHRFDPTGTSPTEDETNYRPGLAALGALSNTTTQTFDTWEPAVGQYPALQALYDQAGGVDLKARVNALAESIVGAGAGGLAGTAGVTGPFKLQVEFIHRSDNSAVVIVAATPLASYIEPAIFTMGDTAGGSGVAQFADTTGVQCEVFAPGTPEVDFLFVVDDSGSMADSQGALADTATAIGGALNNSALDWRIAMVSSGYHESNTGEGGTAQNFGVVRGFTRDINEFTAWLTEDSDCVANVCTGVAGSPPCNEARYPGNGGDNGGCWIGIDGLWGEGVLGAARNALDDLTPATVVEADDSVRDDAIVVVVLLGDADDQTEDYDDIDRNCNFSSPGADPGCEAVANFNNYFNTTNPLGVPVKVHGIICPEGGDCNGEYQADPQRHAQVITATGGVRGDIDTPASIATASAAIISDAIGQAGHVMLKPPIGASIKVAVDAVEDPIGCNANDLPRSRIDGFDFDGVNQTLSFFGACRPAVASVEAAVSYRYWIEQSLDPDGTPPPCEEDPFFDPNDPDFCAGNLVCNTNIDTCECPSDCGGGAPAGYICDTNVAVCDFVCSPDCGGQCGGFETCNTDSCACECVQSASCPVGYEFDSDACDCVCDGDALGCPSTYEPDLDSCTCVCQPDCGGCETGTTCNTSTCACEVDIVVE